MLAGQSGDGGADAAFDGGFAGDGDGACAVALVVAVHGFELDRAGFPPVELCDLVHAAFLEPCFVAQRREVVRLRKFLLYALECWVAEMVVVVVADDYDVDGGEIFELAGRWCEALQALDVDGRAAVLEHGVEEHAQTAREFDIVARMAKPGRSQLRCFAGRKEGRCLDRYGRRCSVGLVSLACKLAPARSSVAVLSMYYKMRYVREYPPKYR